MELTPQELDTLVEFFKLLREIEDKHKRQETDENLYNVATETEE